MTSSPSGADKDLHACRLRLRGQVQGVGFRPFVFRLAAELGIRGWVRNALGQVEIHAESDQSTLTAFQTRLLSDSPPLAKAQLMGSDTVAVEAFKHFKILASDAGAEADIVVPPDHFMCSDCQLELNDPGDRRYGYPFLNCTQCGPRWTLITDLPYDRPNTTLKEFPLCADCSREYEDPMDRRFHAEPVACPECGPWLSYRSHESDQALERDEALQAAVLDIQQGKIVAVKGVGGYHLMCDARQNEVVQRLRQRKHRPGKPFAVMFPASGTNGLDSINKYLQPTDLEAQALTSPERPIVLTAARDGTDLAADIAPGLTEIGAFLPYSPLHQLLLQQLSGPVIATSGNISGEPVITDPQEAAERLVSLADSFLHHNRPITRPADDSVVRSLDGAIRPLRVGRGLAPVAMDLPFPVVPMLAVGAHMKNTIAIGFGARAVISPHIGEMDSRRSLEVFKRVVTDLPGLYQIEPEYLVCDAHPDYVPSKWARQQPLPCIEVFHHHAHASALWGEHQQLSPDSGLDEILVFTWDGVGYGADGSLWGGEALWGRPGAWQREGSLRAFQLPGGEQVGRQPWRSATGLMWSAGQDWQPDLPDNQLKMLKHAFERSINAPQSTAVGRLFDAAACLVLGISHSSFEAEGPMQLEALAAAATPVVGPTLPVVYSEDLGRYELDWRASLEWLLDNSRARGERAYGFHHSLAQALATMAECICEARGGQQVGLTGGVFQNRLLCHLAAAALRQRGFDVLLPARLPANDAAIAYGQLVEASACMNNPGE